jgi:serine/threonine protein kinase
MERLQGEALAERLARAPLQDAEIGEVFGALASAVKAAHAIGVVHRDLKPGEVRIEARCGANDPQGPLRPAVPGKRQAAPQPLAVQFWLA